MSYFEFILFTILMLGCNGKLSNQRLCGDLKCSVPVSMAKTLIRYASPADHILSFQPNVDAIVYSKNAGTKDDLWGIEINGMRGYAPKSLLRENRILVKQLDLVSAEIDISDIKETPPLNEIKFDATANSRFFPAMGVSAENMATDSPLLPTDMLPSYEVVDGTTLFNNPIAAEHTKPSNPSATTKSMHTLPHSDPAKTTTTVPNIQPSSGEASVANVDVVDIAPEKLEENEAVTKSEEDKSDVTESEENKSDEEEEEMEEGEEEGEGEEEEEKEEVVVEEEGSTARGIYRYLSGLLTGEGSGSHANEKVEKINVPSNKDASVKEKEQAEQNKEKDQVSLTMVGGIYEKEQNVLNIDSGIQEKKDVVLNEDGGQDREQEVLNKDAEIQEQDQVSLTMVGGIHKKEQNVLNIDSGIQEKKEVILNEDKGGQDREQEVLNKDAGIQEKEQEGLNIDEEIQEKEHGELNKDAGIQEQDQVSLTMVGGIHKKEQNVLNIDSGIQEKKDVVLNEDGGQDREQEVLNKDAGIQEKEQEGLNIDEEIQEKEHAELNKDAGIQEKDQVSLTMVGGIQEKEQIILSKDVGIQGMEQDTLSNFDVKNTEQLTIQPDIVKIIGETDSLQTELKDLNTGAEEIAPPVGESVVSTDSDQKQELNIVQEKIDVAASGGLEIEKQELSETEGTIKRNIGNSDATVSLLPEGEVLQKVPEQSVPLNAGSLVGSLTYDRRKGENPELTGSEADKELADKTLAPVEQVSVSEGETRTSNLDSESERVTTEIVDESRPQAVTNDGGSILDIEDTGVMTYVSSFFSGMTGLFTSPKIEDNDHEDQKNVEEDTEHREDTYMASGNLDHPSCSADGIDDCANMLPTTTPDVFVDAGLPIEPTTHTQFTEELDHLPSVEITLYLTVTAITVLLFTLGHFFIEKSKQDAALVRKINSLEKSLLVSAKECALVTNELQATMERDTSDDGKNSAVAVCLSEELEEKKRECAELEDQVANLQGELDAATDAGMDLNRMLTEFLSTQHSTNALMESVEQMQAQLNSQQGTINSMDSLLAAKGIENENLQGELYFANDKIESLERDLNKATASLSELLVGKAKQDEGIGRERLELQHQVTELLARRQAETDNFSAEIALLQSQVAQLKESLAAKETELAVTQECIAQLSESAEFRGSNKVQDVVDVGRARAELAAVTAQRDALVDELKEERGAIKFLDDHVKVISEEVETLRETCRLAEEERAEATMKLKVLSSYFEEKEMQLQKDLDMQEAISVKTTGDMSSTCELVGSLQEQMKSYRSQNETLKKEIIDQERELKDQIAALERKAHENWVSARQAERKVEEMKQEAGQLRNLLTIAEKPSAKQNQSSDQVAMNDRLSMDVNGELPTSPLHVGMGLGGLIEMPLPYPPIMSPPTIAYPPPHLGGVPFMPPPTYSYDRRPPPLGCMSSPPLLPPTARHYSRHYEHHSPDRLSPDRGFRGGARGMPPPPPSGPAGFRPFPRTSKGSNLSSDHSSGSLEK